MKEITILGAGYSGLNLIKKIRGKNTEMKITLIDKRQFYFDNVTYLESLSHKETIGLNDFAKEYNIEFINCQVEKINPKRKKIYLKEGEPLSFQMLVLASGLKSKKISVNGEHREGFFYFSDIDPYKVRDLLKFNNDTAVYVSSMLGLKLAVTLRILKKEVRIVAPALDFLGEDANRVATALNERGIQLYLNASIEEAIGEGCVKALKIVPLKIFPAEAIFIDSGWMPNIDFFDEAITGVGRCFTKESDIFILGDGNKPNLDGEFFYTDDYKEIDAQTDNLIGVLFSNKTPIIPEKTPNDTGLISDNQENRKKVVEILLKRLESIPNPA